MEENVEEKIEKIGEKKDVRWKQRFQNYKKALDFLKRGIEIQKERELSELERGGIIHAFEFTQELSWKVLKDFIEEKGIGESIYGSKDAIRQALNRSLISEGETWMEMIKARNLSSNTYDEEDSLNLVKSITEKFTPCLSEMERKFDGLSKSEP